MRKSMVIVALAVSVASCSEREIPDTTVLQGTWRVFEEHGEPLAVECQSATYEIAATTITMRSGTLAVTTRYRAFENGGDLRLEQSSLTHNGGQNCQGLSADYVTSHYLESLDVDLIGERLRIYWPSRQHDSYTDFVRADGSSGNESKASANGAP